MRTMTLTLTLTLTTIIDNDKDKDNNNTINDKRQDKIRQNKHKTYVSIIPNRKEVRPKRLASRGRQGGDILLKTQEDTSSQETDKPKGKREDKRQDKTRHDKTR
jgi:hypothetical protein